MRINGQQQLSMKLPQSTLLRFGHGGTLGQGTLTPPPPDEAEIDVLCPATARRTWDVAKHFDMAKVTMAKAG